MGVHFWQRCARIIARWFSTQRKGGGRASEFRGVGFRETRDKAPYFVILVGVESGQGDAAVGALITMFSLSLSLFCFLWCRFAKKKWCILCVSVFLCVYASICFLSSLILDFVRVRVRFSFFFFACCTPGIWYSSFMMVRFLFLIFCVGRVRMCDDGERLWSWVSGDNNKKAELMTAQTKKMSVV